MGEPNYGTRWSRDDTILAYRLYCELPFGQLDQRNPRVATLASALGRSPGSVALKLSNLAHLDPALRARGIGGMANVSALDREVASTFAADWDTMIEATETRWLSVFRIEQEPSAEEFPSDVPTEALSIVKVRLKQAFFRRTVISAYDSLCCMCLLSSLKLLTASHIKPWAVATPSERLDPRNGMLLCALHDRAFDCGLLTVTSQFNIQISRQLLVARPTAVERSAFLDIDGASIRMPSRFSPSSGFLEHHNREIFVG